MNHDDLAYKSLRDVDEDEEQRSKRPFDFGWLLVVIMIAIVGWAVIASYPERSACSELKEEMSSIRNIIATDHIRMENPAKVAAPIDTHTIADQLQALEVQESKICK